MDRADHLPGRSPRVETDRGVTTFTFRIDVYDEQVVELVVRCEESGEMLVALRSAKKPQPPA